MKRPGFTTLVALIVCLACFVGGILIFQRSGQNADGLGVLAAMALMGLSGTCFVLTALSLVSE